MTSAHPAPQVAPPEAPDAPESGPLARRTIELVQQSWAKVLPISDAAATLFYGRLFELDPSLRALFKSDLDEQKKKLMQMLAVAVDGLNNPGKLIPVLQALGERHAGYMVVDRHYERVGEALLWTLREGLGDGFTSDVEEAWTAVYTLIAGVMKDAAARVGAAKPAHKPVPRPQGFTAPLPAPFLDDGPLESPPLGAQTLVGLSSVAPPSPQGALYDNSAPRNSNVPHSGAPHNGAPHNGAPHNGNAPQDSDPSIQVEPDDEAATVDYTLPRSGARDQGARAIVVPVTGHDMTFHVHVTMASPIPAAPPHVVEAKSSAILDVGALLALFCAAASLGITMLLGLNARSEAGPPAATLYGVPLLVMGLVFAAFSFGYISRRDRARPR